MMDFAFHARQVRLWILKGLAHVYPNKLDLAGIANILAGVDLSTTEPELWREIEYLTEKGYVAHEEKGKGALKRTVVRLRAKGLDLLDGNIEPDPGVGGG